MANLNIVINAAGTVEFDTRLDLATSVNVTGAVALMQLADQCVQFEAFVQVSTLFAVSDRTGFIDEKQLDSPIDWASDYKAIRQMDSNQILEAQENMIGKFPNNYCYSKRMAEEILVQEQGKLKNKFPLIIIRPSIIAASFEEPVPGWTDSLGLIGGFYAIAGHGILRDLPLNPKLIGD